MNREPASCARRSPDPLGHGHGVGVGLLAHRELHRRHAVQPRPEPLLLVGVGDLGDLGERDPLAACRAPASSTFRMSSTLRNLPAVLPTISKLGEVTLPTAMSWFSARMRAEDVGDGEPVGAQPLLVERHADLADEPAGDVHRGHALDREQLRVQAQVHPVAQVHQIAGRRAEAHLEDRDLGRVELEDVGRLGLDRQPGAGAIEVLRGVLEREVDVGAVAEVQIDVAVALGGLALELDQVLGGRQARLEDLGDLLLHDLRSDSRVGHADADLRIDDLRQQIERAAVRRRTAPPPRPPTRRPARRSGAGWRGWKARGASRSRRSSARRCRSSRGSPADCGPLAPGRRFTWPELTTRSPALEPARRPRSSPRCVSPVSTGRRTSVSAATT